MTALCAACGRRHAFADMCLLWIDPETGAEMVGMFTTIGKRVVECWGYPAPVCVSCLVGDFRMQTVRDELRGEYERGKAGASDG
jgi:hypothetical protein